LFSTEPHYMFFIKQIILRSTILVLLLSSFVAKTQGGEENKMLAEELSKSTELKAAVPVQNFYAFKRREAEADADFEKFEVKKEQYKSSISYEAGAIDRTYSVNNPFDVEDLNNPFNLARSGSRVRNNAKKKDSESYQKFFSALFEYKQAPKKSVVNKKPEMVPPSWMLFSLLSVLSVFAYQIVAFKAENKKTLQAFASSSSALQQHRDQKTMLTPHKLLSDILFVLTLGHFVYVGTNVYLHSGDIAYNWSLSNLLLSIVGVSAISFLKNFQTKIMGTIFPFKQQLNYNYFILNNTFKVLALVLTPLLFFMTYSPESVKLFAMYTGLLLVAASGVYSFFRMTLASTEIILENKFHFFIYLCGVELAPLLILLKFLSVI